MAVTLQKILPLGHINKKWWSFFHQGGDGSRGLLFNFFTVEWHK